mmetsp:Transcript_72580/g.190247  ORF Transcript_72580/g.190247 Transcript_72580/m.190247 type:complete len:238 (-) Transcript_72580:746-1459(-)
MDVHVLHDVEHRHHLAHPRARLRDRQEPGDHPHEQAQDPGSRPNGGRGQDSARRRVDHRSLRRGAPGRRAADRRGRRELRRAGRGRLCGGEREHAHRGADAGAARPGRFDASRVPGHGRAQEVLRPRRHAGHPERRPLEREGHRNRAGHRSPHGEGRARPHGPLPLADQVQVHRPDDDDVRPHAPLRVPAVLHQHDEGPGTLDHRCLHRTLHPCAGPESEHARLSGLRSEHRCQAHG